MTIMKCTVIGSGTCALALVDESGQTVHDVFALDDDMNNPPYEPCLLTADALLEDHDSPWSIES